MIIRHAPYAIVGGPIRFGTLGDAYVEWDSSGQIRLYGAATGWDDLRVPVATTRLGGTKDPDWAQLKDNGSGSQGVFIQWFDDTTEEEVYFEVQMPHAWKQGSDIYPHVHWVPKTTGASGNYVKWGLEYTWANINGSFGNTTIIYNDITGASTATSSGDAVMAADKHYLSALTPVIDATGKTLSSMLCCRLFRDAGSDGYGYDAGLLEVDFHYEIDSFGSESEYIKL